eukprot:2362022-Prymnesium_polylepis.1
MGSQHDYGLTMAKYDNGGRRLTALAVVPNQRVGRHSLARSAAVIPPVATPKGRDQSEGGLQGEVWQHPKEATSQRAGCSERAQGSGSCWGAGEALSGGRGRERRLQEGTEGPMDSSCVELRGAGGMRCSHVSPVIGARAPYLRWWAPSNKARVSLAGGRRARR